jgi:hypothetical protein
MLYGISFWETAATLICGLMSLLPSRLGETQALAPEGRTTGIVHFICSPGPGQSNQVCAFLVEQTLISLTPIISAQGLKCPTQYFLSKIVCTIMQKQNGTQK